MSYAAPTTYAAPQMSYVPQATYGGYPGAATHSPYLDEKTIKQQETDATAALDGQAGMQQKMLDHQYTTQKEMITAECTRNIEMAKNQFEQQRNQALMALDLQQKLATLYSGAGKTATTGATEKKAATTKKA